MKQTSGLQIMYYYYYECTCITITMNVHILLLLWIHMCYRFPERACTVHFSSLHSSLLHPGLLHSKQFPEHPLPLFLCKNLTASPAPNTTRPSTTQLRKFILTPSKSSHFIQSRLPIWYTANAHNHATPHCATMTPIVCKVEFNSLRMVAIAATQGV